MQALSENANSVMTIRLQRKPPARRAFSGLVGRAELEDTPAEPNIPAVVPETAPALAIPTPDRFGPLPLSEEAQQLRKQKEAERGRERRKNKREQLATIKKALKTPIAEIMKAEKDQHRLD